MVLTSVAWEKLLIFVMALASRVLASGPGWRVQDVVCTSGPHDPPFEERHDGVCIAAVTGGTFRYRSSLGSTVLAPGALLLGNDRHCFECSHEHGVGDRCLSFRLAPEFLETVVSSVPGVRRASFSVPRLPPHDRLLPMIAAAEAARDDSDAGAFEELVLRIAGAVSGALNESKTRAPAPGVRDERRITAALRYIELSVDESLSIAELAQVAAMSSYYPCTSETRRQTPTRFFRISPKTLDFRLYRVHLSRRLPTATGSAFWYPGATR